MASTIAVRPLATPAEFGTYLGLAAPTFMRDVPPCR